MALRVFAGLVSEGNLRCFLQVGSNPTQVSNQIIIFKSMRYLYCSMAILLGVTQVFHSLKMLTPILYQSSDGQLLYLRQEGVQNVDSKTLY